MKKKIILIIFIFLVNLNFVSSKQIRTSDKFKELPLSNEEEWSVKGKSYKINETALLGGLMYIIKVVIKEDANILKFNDARDIAIHSLVNGYYFKACNVGKNHLKLKIMDTIGVALINKDGQNVKGYRFKIKVPILLKQMNTKKMPYMFRRNRKTFTKDFVKAYNKLDYLKLHGFLSLKFKVNYPITQLKRDYDKLHTIVKRIKRATLYNYLYLGDSKIGPLYHIHYKIKFIGSDNKIHTGFIKYIIVDQKYHYDVFGIRFFL